MNEIVLTHNDKNRRIDTEYWKKYYKFWDEFVAYWFSLRQKNSQAPQGKELTFKEYEKILQAYKKVTANNGFKEDELPEPYQGDPGHQGDHKTDTDHNKTDKDHKTDKDGVDAVVLNLNPGTSQKGHYGAYKDKNLEATKFYEYIDKPDKSVPSGWLIRKFRDEAKCSYREFASEWSCLKPNLRYELHSNDPDFREVCGVEWWQGNDADEIGGHMKWIRRIYDNEQLCPSRVFAPEICPFHSKSFPTNSLGDLKDFIKKRVIIPAARAVIENGLHFAVAIGKSYADVLTAIGAKLEKEWWDGSENVNDWNWPKTKDERTGGKRLVHRKYCLFVLKDECGRLIRFLVCAAPGSNGVPSKEFGKRIEKGLILPYVKKNPLTNESYQRLELRELYWWSSEKEEKDLSKDCGEVLQEVKNARTKDYPNDKKQSYQRLWNGFRDWCSKNGKSWLKMKPECDYADNTINPAGGGDLHLLFRVDGRDKKLKLGIYSPSDMRQAIKSKCQRELDKLAHVNWTFGRDGQKSTTILLEVNGDWRNTGEELFKEMARFFECVGNILRNQGFNI